MALTYTSPLDRDRVRHSRRRPFERIDLLPLVVAILSAALMATAYTGRMRAFAATETTTAPINLNTVVGPDALMPALSAVFPLDAERRRTARALFKQLVADDGSRQTLPNVGAIARTRVLDSRELATVKPLLAVRTVDDFRRQVSMFGAAFIIAFLVVPIVWRVTGIEGDLVSLAAVQLLTAIGFSVLLTRPDPVRDTLLCIHFAQTVLAGIAVMLAASMIPFARLEALRLSYVPLLGALALSLLLLVFGTGPGNSLAKVNLGPVQPIEGIRLLLGFFLAGYFARRWQLLRSLRGTTVGNLRVPSWVSLPRLEYLLPVVVGVGVSLMFFFFQKDLGPALFLCCVFLAVYAVARRRIGMAVVGLLLLLAGFYVGHLWHVSGTLDARVEMWLSPWDNSVAGGNQVTHAIWAMATGGPTGVGLGLGSSKYLPAGHTDLILAAIGEELGLAGLLLVCALFVVLTWRSLKIARTAAGDYGFFLALALTLFLVVPVFIMAAGIMGLMPLTGVVTPFLSYGGSAMLANFLALGLLASIRADRRPAGDATPFVVPVRRLAAAFAVVAVVLIGRAAYVQVLRADELAVRPHLGIQADGGRRFEYNPRLLEVLHALKSGSVLDRTGLPLATSDAAVIDAARDRYRALGIDLAVVCPRPDERCYPLGDRAFHLLGNARTRANWSAPNTSYIERDAENLLRGFDDHAAAVQTTDVNGQPMLTMRRDYTALVPVLRHRYEPTHPAVVRLFNAPHDLSVTIDAALQYRVADIIAASARKAGGKAAAVVIDPTTGALLASASYPWPSALPEVAADATLDRARYGLYPPGSTFKIVIEAAVLRAGVDPGNTTFTCSRLPDGRVGAKIKGFGRPIRDDIEDTVPHGTIGLHEALTHSCNAYFAQLAVRLGAQPVIDAATQLGIALTPQARTLERVRETLPQVGYGQADVLASPLRMARAAGAVGNNGLLRDVTWRADQGENRAQIFLEPAAAAMLGHDMREVVQSGTGRMLKDHAGRIAGKTGTAEILNKPSHGWFIGYAPFGNATRTIAFAVIIENAGYGGATAAPAAGAIVSAAMAAGLVK